MKPSTDILQFGHSFRYEVYHGGRRFVSDDYPSRESAEFGLKNHIASMGSLSRNVRFEQFLEELGMACCRMAYKLAYCSGMPLDEVSRLLGVTEDEAEKAYRAGEYTMREFSAFGKLSKERVEEIIDTYFEQGFEDEQD
jgi:hypothetical protein